MNISLLTKINKLKIRDENTRFFSWWGDELRALVPRSIESWIGRDTAHVLVRVDENKTQLLLSTGDDDQILGYCNLASLDSSSGNDFEAMRSIIAAKVPNDATVEVELPQQQLLRCEIFLPLATEFTLNEVVRFEMDRFTPFTVEQVGYTYRVLERLPEREKLKLELTIVRRDYLRELLSDISELGLNVSAVHAGVSASELGETANPNRENLLPPDLRPATEPIWTDRNKKLLGVLLILLGITVIFPILWQTAKIERFETEIAAILDDAKKAGEKQQLLVARLEGQVLLANKKNQHPAKLESLRKLTELLPDNTWVSKLTMDNETLSLQGESGKSSNLIEILEQTDLFKNVEFTSPVTRNTSSQMERYEIQLQLAGEHQ
jgi:general secretion pathway protein L